MIRICIYNDQDKTDKPYLHTYLRKTKTISVGFAFWYCFQGVGALRQAQEPQQVLDRRPRRFVVFRVPSATSRLYNACLADGHLCHTKIHFGSGQITVTLVPQQNAHLACPTHIGTQYK